MTRETAPLTPANCDLRGYEFMPFYGNHLFGSDFNSRASDAEWRAAVTLWWAAWNQVPAASLPDDDTALCRLADMGRELRAWRRIKEVALHGFVKCSDGRLYHKFLAPKACEAWERRLKERERKSKWRQAKDGKKDGDETRTETGTGRGRDGSVPAERRGEERTGTGEDSELLRKKDGKPASAEPAAAPAAPTLPVTPKDRLWRDGPSAIASLAGKPASDCRAIIGRWLKSSTAEQVLDAIAKAQAEKAIDPIPFVTACLNRGKAQRSADGFVPGEFD